MPAAWILPPLLAVVDPVSRPKSMPGQRLLFDALPSAGQSRPGRSRNHATPASSVTPRAAAESRSHGRQRPRHDPNAIYAFLPPAQAALIDAARERLGL